MKTIHQFGDSYATLFNVVVKKSIYKNYYDKSLPSYLPNKKRIKNIR